MCSRDTSHGLVRSQPTYLAPEGVKVTTNASSSAILKFPLAAKPQPPPRDLGFEITLTVEWAAKPLFSQPTRVSVAAFSKDAARCATSVSLGVAQVGVPKRLIETSSGTCRCQSLKVFRTRSTRALSLV